MAAHFLRFLKSNFSVDCNQPGVGTLQSFIFPQPLNLESKPRWQNADELSRFPLIQILPIFVQKKCRFGALFLD